MNGEHPRRGWGAASGVIALVAGGLLTRAACAPVPPPAAPTASAPEARREAPLEGSEHAPALTAVTPAAPEPTSPAPIAPRMAVPPPAAAMRAGSLAAAEPRLPAADAPAQATATSSGTAVPPVEKQELALLASIERELKREPPPEVHALLAEYRGGADRATLVSRVQRDFPKDLRLRVTTLRWIDEVRPDPGRPSQVSSVPGQGTGASWVRPIEHR